MLPPEGKRVTGFSVAFGSLQHGYQRLTMICASLSLLRYGCHRLTTICASLRSFKLCSLVQLMFAAVTPVPLPPLEMTIFVYYRPKCFPLGGRNWGNEKGNGCIAIEKIRRNPSACFADISLWKRETVHWRLCRVFKQLIRGLPRAVWPVQSGIGARRILIAAKPRNLNSQISTLFHPLDVPFLKA